MSKRISPFIGIRVKPLNEELKARSIRTLDIFLTTMLRETQGRLPENFVITLPKVSIPEQVEAFYQIVCDLEQGHGLREGSLKFEIMIETAQAIINQDGVIGVPSLIKAAHGRCKSVHFGTYDYTACNDISASEQVMGHPACSFALQVMKVALAGTEVWLSDGATSIMPVAPHRGEGLTTDQRRENQGLLNYFLRALASGAITNEEVTATGLTLDEIQTRSFLAILEGRKH